jgi:hypothetical protein
MTESAVVCTEEGDNARAGEELGRGILERLDGQPPDALIVFVSPKYEVESFLAALHAACHPTTLVGCSSAGEFLNTHYGVGHACAVGLRSTEMRFRAAMGRGIGRSREAVAAAITDKFDGIETAAHGFRSALVLTDALAGHADELIDQLTLQTKGSYQFFGGGAGDDANFRRTQVFCGTEVASDAAVALEILSTKPIGVGVRHGWEPVGEPLRVTQSEGARIIGLNAGVPAEAFEEHAARTGQRFDRADPIPFFLHNILGIDTGQGYKLRVPLAVHEDGTISCAAEVPQGSVVHIMSTSSEQAAGAAASAAFDAVSKLDGNEPACAIFFDCVATRLRMGKDFGIELQSVQDVLKGATFAGCNTYGQVARAEGQFSGFHNCTAVVCAIPR